MNATHDFDESLVPGIEHPGEGVPKIRGIFGPGGRFVQRYQVHRGTTDDKPLLQHSPGQAGTRDPQSWRAVKQGRARADAKQLIPVLRDPGGITGGQAEQVDCSPVEGVRETHPRRVAGLGKGVPAGDETDVVAVPAKPAVAADAARGLDAVRAGCRAPQRRTRDGGDARDPGREPSKRLNACRSGVPGYAARQVPRQRRQRARTRRWPGQRRGRPGGAQEDGLVMQPPASAGGRTGC